jgi:hypothetical protein
MTMGIRTASVAFAGAIALLLQIAPVMAENGRDNNRPVDISFTKWGVTAPLPPAPQPPFGIFEGFSGDGLPGSFVAEVHVRGRRRGPFVHGAHPGRAECGGRRSARRCHPGRVALRCTSASRVSEVCRYCRDAQLRGRTHQQNVFRGNHPRRARANRTELSPPPLERRARLVRSLGCSWQPSRSAHVRLQLLEPVFDDDHVGRGCMWITA